MILAGQGEQPTSPAPLPDHVQGLVSLDRSPRRVEGTQCPHTREGTRCRASH